LTSNGLPHEHHPDETAASLINKQRDIPQIWDPWHELHGARKREQSS
jgi:hypothetical protein